MIFIPSYQIDFELREIKLFKLIFFTSEVFNQNEIDIIKQLYDITEIQYQGCFYDFNPRQIKVTFLNSEFIQFINPFRGGTQEYNSFINKVTTLNNFREYETIPEKVPYRYLKRSFMNG